MPGVSSVKSMQYPTSGPSGRGQVGNRVSSGAIVSEPVEAGKFDPLIGRKVRTRWPDDNNFYEAVITNYNPAEVYLFLFVCMNRVLVFCVADFNSFVFLFFLLLLVFFVDSFPGTACFGL